MTIYQLYSRTCVLYLFIHVNGCVEKDFMSGINNRTEMITCQGKIISLFFYVRLCSSNFNWFILFYILPRPEGHKVIKLSSMSFLLVLQNHSIKILDISSDWLLKILLKLLMIGNSRFWLFCLGPVVLLLPKFSII